MSKPSRCQVCQHPDRARMELMLARGVALRIVAAKFETSADALHRHRHNHMPPQLVAALKAKSLKPEADLEKLRIEESEGLLQHLMAQRGRLYRLLDSAEELGNIPDATKVHALDPVQLAIDCGITPDRWQADVLTSTARKALLLCSRQSGKSTTTALLALHEALYAAPAMILLVSPSMRQSSELFKKVVDLWRRLEGAPEAEQESLTRLQLKNGSRIVSLPGSEATTRGYSAVTLAIVDEASRVTDELLAAIRPALATTNGRLVALSTPAGKRGWFHEQWTRGVGWERTKVTAADCPRITADFLEDERRELGEYIFAQEYMCEFYDADTQVFSTEIIERSLSDDVEPLWQRTAA